MVLVLVGLLCQEGGAAMAVTIFPLVGAVGAAALRVGLSAVVLVALVRPSLRGHARGDWTVLLGYGASLAAMNVCFYLTLTRLDLGTAVTIEVLGPLALSVAVARRWSSVAWALLALSGVALLGAGPHRLDGVGVLLALAAAGSWALYIVLAARIAVRFPGLSGLTLGMLVAAVIVVPLAAIVSGPALLHGDVLLLGLVVALLSSALPYGLELVALRHLPASSFSVLVSLAPVNAALVGFLVLGQGLTATAAVGIALVAIASAGALRTPRPRTATSTGPAQRPDPERGPSPAPGPGAASAPPIAPPPAPGTGLLVAAASEQDRAECTAASPPEHPLSG